jgi:hypothetical protein
MNGLDDSWFSQMIWLYEVKLLEKINKHSPATHIIKNNFEHIFLVNFHIILKV